ncbi:interferon gamma receptor 1 isoform X2 [Micropterus dolomieu]|uniref:interferon gamma receptor 1 isoform X2 n=1 Tax=Micropterus dolomieu TaxID=147949 RepID=UPI001E8E7F00|nr:interferon gamma receptor 1 isoform X2 [Micropterus dolomieu]
MLLDGAFTVLLLISGASAVSVPPPTKVVVSCQNLKVTVSWEYSKPQPQTTFRVEVKGSTVNDEEETTTDHQYDLSHFVWASDERYMGFNYVSVTAIQGGHRSVPVPSKTFSFSAHKTADIICKLNFPPVDLKVEDSGAKVMFRNPLHYYSELKQADNSASFKFTVSPGGEGECLRSQEICVREIEFPEGAEQCVNLTGSLIVDNQLVSFSETHNICRSIPPWVYVTVGIILLLVLVVVLTVVSIFICMTRPPEDENSHLPKNLPNHGKPYYTVNPPHISPVVVLTVNEPGTEEEAEHLTSEGQKTNDDDSSDGSVKTECTSVDDEEEEKGEESTSSYDRPQNLQVDMGDAEMVTGYSGC